MLMAIWDMLQVASVGQYKARRVRHHGYLQQSHHFSSKAGDGLDNEDQGNARIVHMPAMETEKDIGMVSK